MFRNSRHPQHGSHDCTPAYACFDAADGDPELALTLALDLLKRGLFVISPAGTIRVARLPEELARAA